MVWKEKGSFPNDLSPQNALFYNFLQVFSFKHGRCSFLDISKTMRNTKSHSELVEGKEGITQHMCESSHGDPARRWIPESAAPTQPPGTDMWNSCAHFSGLPPSLLTALVINQEFGKWLGIFPIPSLLCLPDFTEHSALHFSLFWKPPASICFGFSE